MTWQHGTVTGYSKCGGGGRLACDECRAENTARARQLRRRRAYGRPTPTDRLDPSVTTQALHHLSAAGHTVHAIEQLTGLPNPQVYRLLNDQNRWVTRDTQDRALAGLSWAIRNPFWRLRDDLIDSTRALQQIRSLEALGWRLEDLYAELGCVSSGKEIRPLMRRQTAERIQELYDRLGGTRGPSKRAAAHAARLGWHVPLAYDEDGQLVPEAIPNALSEARERREDRRERVEEIARLTARGLSSREIAERLGIADRTVTRGRSRRSA